MGRNPSSVPWVKQMVRSLALFIPPADRARCRLAVPSSTRFVQDLVIQGVIALDEAAEHAMLSEALLLESQLPVTIVNVSAGTVRHMPMFLEYQAARRTWLDAELTWLARDATIDASSVFTAAAPYILAAAACRMHGIALIAAPWL